MALRDLLKNNTLDITSKSLAHLSSQLANNSQRLVLRLYSNQRAELEKIIAQASPQCSRPLSTPIVTPIASIAQPIATNATLPLSFAKSETAPTVPLEEKYLLKSLRFDEYCFADQFFRMITPSATMQEKLPVRLFLKKAYTVTGLGVFERAKKQPLFPKEQKTSFSKHCSTTLVTDRALPPLFGHSDRNKKLVGVIISLKDALINRLFSNDCDSVGRPYDFDSKEEADKYFEAQVLANEPKLFDNLEKFENAIATRKSGQGSAYNEVLARLRWNLNGSSKIFIGSDTLEARLIAQEYARLLLNRLRQQAKENHLEWNEEYQVPICFYLPGTSKHATDYDGVQQQNDIALATEIDRDLHEPGQRANKYETMNYEFLLAVPRPHEIMQEKYKGQSLVQKILHEGYVHIVQNLLERANDPTILERVPLDAERLSAETFYYVAQAGNVQLMRWLLTKRSTAKTPTDLYPALAGARWRGHAQIVEMIINTGILARLSELKLAAEANRWDIVKIFLNNATQPGAAQPSLEERLCYKWILKLAVAKVDIDIDIIASLVKLYPVRYVLKPSDEEQKCYDRIFKLAIAKVDPDIDFIASLIKLGALHQNFAYQNYRIRGDNLLHWAIKANNPALVKVLVLVEYVDILQTNDNGQTPIELAAANQHWALVDIIAGTELNRSVTMNDVSRYEKVLERIATLRATTSLTDPVYSAVVKAVVKINPEIMALLQQQVADWADTAKSELLAKYKILQDLKKETLNQKWHDEKEICQTGITFFSASAPSGVQQLQQTFSQFTCNAHMSGR